MICIILCVDYAEYHYNYSLFHEIPKIITRKSMLPYSGNSNSLFQSNFWDQAFDDNPPKLSAFAWTSTCPSYPSPQHTATLAKRSFYCCSSNVQTNCLYSNVKSCFSCIDICAGRIILRQMKNLARYYQKFHGPASGFEPHHSGQPFVTQIIAHRCPFKTKIFVKYHPGKLKDVLVLA